MANMTLKVVFGSTVYVLKSQSQRVASEERLVRKLSDTESGRKQQTGQNDGIPRSEHKTYTKESAQCGRLEGRAHQTANHSVRACITQPSICSAGAFGARKQADDSLRKPVLIFHRWLYSSTLRQVTRQPRAANNEPGVKARTQQPRRTPSRPRATSR